MNNILEVKELTKKFKDHIAVNNISFQLQKNKIYGLLGRNGAGKTTIMKLLTGQIFPSKGEIKIFGESPLENRKVLRQICFIKESQKYPDLFQVNDVLETAATLYPNWDQQYAEQLIQEFHLPKKRYMKKLSRGMFSAVGIIVGLASRAPLTIFDEPYLGLDAVARGQFYDQLIMDYTKHPRTIILSTHLIDEVSKLLEHVFVLDQGQVLIDEDVDVLREQAFTIVGTKEKVEAFAANKEILSQTSLGTLVSIAFRGKVNATERMELQRQNIELQPLSLQQLVVYLTTGKDGENK